jgi:tetratricopeptide (TPR) repeat protein
VVYGLLTLGTAVLAVLAVAVSRMLFFSEPPSPAGPVQAEADLTSPVTPVPPQAPVPSPLPPPEAAAAPASVPVAVTRVTQAPQPREGFSWAQAEQAYAARRYSEALPMFAGLLERSEKSAANQRVSDYLRLRVAGCLKRIERTREARKAFQEAADSGSPLVRASACYEMGLMDLAEGQPLLARMRAYQAIGALGAVNSQPSVETQSEFLAAQALSQKVASLFNREGSIPRYPVDETDLFAGLSETDLRHRLDEGADRLAAASLGPWVQSVEGDHMARRWNVVSWSAPLEELLARLTAQSGLEIRWEGMDLTARRRPVVLLLSGVTDQRLVEVACGCVGLVARFTGAEMIVHDPAAYTSTTAQCDILMREAVSAWRRFFLRSSDDARVAHGRFSLGLLYERAGDTGNAVTEYQVIAQRYPRNRLAPLARLRTATLRLDLRDYMGARQELLDLLNRYPDCSASDEVYLRLGQADMEGGRLDEAIQTFRKLYFLDLSLTSRAGAALGAAKCCFNKGQYDEANTWLARRIELGQVPGDDHLSEAYAYLAKTEAARGHLAQAIDAYKRALAVPAPAKDEGDVGRRIEMLLDLARVLIQQEDFVPALAVLESFSPRDATPRQAEELLLVKAEVLRSMHLPQRAIALLKRGLASPSSPETAGRMTLEMARCLAETDGPEATRQMLTDALPKMEAGPTACQASLALAEACLKLGRGNQAAAVCRELLKLNCSPDVRRRTQAILGAAYACEKDYQRAALALTGKTPDGPGASKP